MINAVMHILAWGLVVVLVWGHLEGEPSVQQKSHFQGVAELGGGTYLVAAGENSRYGLVKFDGADLGFRAIKLDDWERNLEGQVIGLCAVKGYEGEVVAAIEKSEGNIALVHIQVRNWSKTPRSAILGQVIVPDIQSIAAFSCGDASQSTMPVTLYGQGQNYTADYDFGGYQLSSVRQATPVADLRGAYENELGLWAVVSDKDAQSSVVWLFPAVGEAFPAFRLDGFKVTGIAAGPKGYDISVVTSEPSLGSVWRPLRLAAGPLSQ